MKHFFVMMKEELAFQIILYIQWSS